MEVYNPFEALHQELREIKEAIARLDKERAEVPQREIIDRKELGKRLNLSEATLIRYGDKRLIPEIKVGGSVRYCYQDVLDALQKQNPRKYGR